MSKYRNEKKAVGGVVFDSKKEANRYSELLLLEKAGAITDLKRQVKYILIPKQYSKREVTNDGRPKLIERECSYIADFTYVSNGKLVVEDVKGMRTKEYRIKRKLMLFVHGIRISEV